MKKLLTVLLTVFLSFYGFAQSPGMQTLSLDDMSQFRSNAGNWFIAGSVTMDPDAAPHHEEETIVAGKKDRKKKNQPAPVVHEAVTFEPGKGVLLNMNTKEKKDHLITTWEHGDIDLELEVMLPRGSNSGIYLQGGYEIQLLDSWGVKNASFSDIGGIYRNWETEAGKIYMGKAPAMNAAKAPGLWQTMKISFRAPRFNANGEKISNARFVSVILNGVKIHDNVEVPKLTGGPLDSKEKPMGPLMLQGDHGSIAFRNIRYRLMQESDVSLSEISYKLFHGNFNNGDSFLIKKPVKTGMIPQLTWQVSDVDDDYGIIYNGNLNIARDGEYQFELNYTGNATLSIDNQKVITNQYNKGVGKMTLKKGSHPFEIVYNKSASWQPGRLGFFISGANTNSKGFHAFSSFPPGDDIVAPIYVRVGSEPRLLRAFLDFKGDNPKRLTHTIAVGEPAGIHYIYDLQAGNIACLWRGDFIDATPMWHDRGDGSYRPMGMVQYLFTQPSLADLSDANAPFPAETNKSDFRSRGYSVQEGRPVFNYTYKGVEVTDKIYPDTSARLFTRELAFKNATAGSLYYKLADGADIKQLHNGSYTVDQKYYINVLSDVKPVVREQAGKKELVIKVDGNPIKYSIIW